MFTVLCSMFTVLCSMFSVQCSMLFNVLSPTARALGTLFREAKERASALGTMKYRFEISMTEIYCEGTVKLDVVGSFMVGSFTVGSVILVVFWSCDLLCLNL